MGAGDNLTLQTEKCVISILARRQARERGATLLQHWHMLSSSYTATELVLDPNYYLIFSVFNVRNVRSVRVLGQ
jgi:murein L,D-transpeptidase YafK